MPKESSKDEEWTGNEENRAMAVRKSRKIEAQVVEAIRRLQTVQGSTPREITNYIAQEYNIPGPEIRRHVQLSLKRGVTYGILQRLKGGNYTYNQAFRNGLCLSGGDNAVEIPCKGRRRRGRGRSRGGKRRKRRRSSRRRRRARSRYRSYKNVSSSGRKPKCVCGPRRKRSEYLKEIDGLASTVLSKPLRSKTLLGKERPSSDHSTVSGNIEEREE